MDETQPKAEFEFDPVGVFRRHAQRLDARWWRWALLGPSYHMFAGALVWADECPRWWRLLELEDALGALWHYRTGLIIGEARPYAELWELGRQLFPHWVGFHPSRCRRSQWYAAIYQAADDAAMRSLAEADDLAHDSDS